MTVKKMQLQGVCVCIREKLWTSVGRKRLLQEVLFPLKNGHILGCLHGDRIVFLLLEHSSELHSSKHQTL